MDEKNLSHKRFFSSRKKAQGMLEFALILPILLLLIFGILDYGRLFFAWISIENAARVGARYASTGEYDPAFCEDLDADGSPCGGDSEDAEISLARIKSIRQESQILFGNPIVDTALNTERSFFDVTICSANPAIQFISPMMGDTTYSACTRIADGMPQEHPGDPGERVIVSIDYNFPFAVPIFGDYFHLASYKEATVETFRVSRVVNLPHDINVPPPPPTSTATPLPTSTSTPTATATPLPDCDLLYLDSSSISNDRIIVKVRNDTGYNMPLTNSSLTWEKQVWDEYVNYFQWNGNTYYKGDDDTPPTNNEACEGSQCSFPTNKTRTWRAGFRPSDIILNGGYTVDLTFGDYCDVQAVFDLPTPTPTSTPDCDLITVRSISTPTWREDEITVNVENENPIEMPLTSSEVTWTASAFINDLRWSRNSGTWWYKYYDGDDHSSPNNSICNDPKCSFPANSTRNWFANFNPNTSLMGTDINLTFGFVPNSCTVSASVPFPELSCDNMGITNFWISGSNLYAEVDNNNLDNMPLVQSRLDWSNYDPPNPDQRVVSTGWARWGWPAYNVNVAGDRNSPTIRPCPGNRTSTSCDFPGRTTRRWTTSFDGADTLSGNYAVELVFSDGTLTCTYNASLYQGTPTPTPIPTGTPVPSCDNVSASNLRRSGDNIQMDITNNNVASGYLTSSSLSWAPYEPSISDDQYLDWIEFGGNPIYNGDDYGPTTNVNSNEELPGGATYTWDADFDNPDAIYGSWALNLSINFADGLSCPLSGMLGPRPTPIPPTPVPVGCDNISAGTPYISGDDIRMSFTNDNNIDVQLTSTNFTWNNISPTDAFVDSFEFNGSSYYGGNDSSSPTNTSNTANLLANSTASWIADFSGPGWNNLPIYGDFTVELTFDVDGVSCPVSGTVHRSAPPPQSCSEISAGTLVEASTNGDGLIFDGVSLNISNTSGSPVMLTNTHFVWTDWDTAFPTQEVDWFQFNGSTYYGGNDASSPTDVASGVALAAGASTAWKADFSPNFDLTGNFSVELTFQLADGTTCPAITRSGYIDTGGGGFE